MSELLEFQKKLLNLMLEGTQSQIPELRDLGMCLSTLGMVGLAEKLSPNGFEGKIVEMCSTIGDQCKLVLSEFMNFSDPEILDRTMERLKNISEGDNVKRNPQHPLSKQIVELVDMVLARADSDRARLGFLQDLSIAIGIRIFDLETSSPELVKL